MKLIAKVPVMVVVDGERITVQPGEELPDLSEHDARELLASGAIADPAIEAKEARAAARAEVDARADFEQAQQRIRQENEARLQAEEQTQAKTDPDASDAADGGGKGGKGGGKGKK